MKTYKHLYPRICAFQNLYTAYRDARRGKRAKRQVYQFEFNAEAELLRLQDELRAQTYQPGAYTSFRLGDAKRRLVSAAPFRDRVVHHALCNLIEPILERKFIDDSYANRKEKGTHRAIDRAQYFAQRHPYVLQADIVQCFPSIDHAILRGILARTIADAPTLWLIDQILASGADVHRAQYRMQWFPGDDLFAPSRPRGLPIGNLTSQFWANVYLNELDQFVKRELKCAAYVRYVDDFVLFADDKTRLWEWKARLVEFLQALRLVVHPGKTLVRRVADGIPFLGWRIFPTHRRLKRDNVRAFMRRFRAQTIAYARGELSLENWTTRTQSWVAHAAHGDTYRLRKKILTASPIALAD
ncbi:MAG: group II intron reverse transcriptase domain-containing protein [Chloroflexi bacterium]|nr:group II intron reverse transcriptase domain-containing protein [Chloroflexota bacterium]